MAGSSMHGSRGQGERGGGGGPPGEDEEARRHRLQARPALSAPVGRART